MAISCHSLIRKKSKGQTKKTLRYATERHSLFANFSSSIHTFFFKRYTEERQQRRRACVCACVVISSEADKKMKELNERQMRASLENSRAPLFSHLQCCGVVRPTREHLGQNSLSLSHFSYPSSFLWSLGCSRWSDGPARVHPSVLVLCFLLRRLQDLETHTPRHLNPHL